MKLQCTRIKDKIFSLSKNSKHSSIRTIIKVIYQYIWLMIAKFLSGIVAYIRALSFVSRRGYGRYFVYSGLIGLLILAGTYYLIEGLVPSMLAWAKAAAPFDIDYTLNETGWLSVIFSGVLFVTTFKYMMLIFTAPIMSALSEKVERDITGIENSRSVIVNIIPDLLRGLRINFRNIIRELLLTGLLLLLGLIPLVGIVSGVLILFVQSYFAGFGNADFWAERHFTYRETVRFMKGNKGMLMGNGIVYIFLLAIPILGAFLAPPLATIAVTIEGTKELERYD